MALQAAAAAAQSSGILPLVLGDALEGEAREAGRLLAGMARGCRVHATPARPPCVLLSGGETTVTIDGAAVGRGGRNTELLAAMALQPDGAAGIWALAADTDGIDGTEDAAGATIDPFTLARAQAAGLDVRAMLDQHNTYSLFAALDNLVVTGPTLTNVNDFSCDPDYLMQQDEEPPCRPNTGCADIAARRSWLHSGRQVRARI